MAPCNGSLVRHGELWALVSAVAEPGQLPQHRKRCLQVILAHMREHLVSFAVDLQLSRNVVHHTLLLLFSLQAAGLWGTCKCGRSASEWRGASHWRREL